MMAEIYANLIRKGQKTIADVPSLIRAQVEAILAADTPPPPTQEV